MARRGSGGGGGMGGGGMMAPVLSIATGLIVFVTLVIFAPTIAGSIEDASPGNSNNEICANGTGVAGAYATFYPCKDKGPFTGTNITTYDPWNTTQFTNIPRGVEVWTTNIQILGVVILIISIAVAMYFLKGMA